jgi:glycosyltransferase involved in cell wall biosynthesis
MKPFHITSPLEFRSVIHQSSHHDARKRVLFLTYRFPYPLWGGDRLKSFHLLRHLSEIADVDLIALDEWESGHGENLSKIKRLCKNVDVIPFNRRAAWARVLFTLPTQTPVEYGWYDVPTMQSAVNNALARTEYDLIICFFLRTAIYVRNVTNIPKILIAEDSRLLMQERSTKEFSLSGEYFIRANEAKKLRRYEPEMMRNFDLVTFVAQPDRAKALELDPTLRTAILTNGIDTHLYRFNGGERVDSILFAGVLSVYSNKRMAERLSERIFPRVRKALPYTRLWVVGKSPSRSLANLVNRTEGAELHPNVREMKTFYERASVFVNAQDAGAGIQNKLLEALALGTAVVTTSYGAKGIAGLRDGVNCFIRETDEEIADAAIELLNNKALRDSFARAGRELIESRYSWEHVFDELDEAIAVAAPDLFMRSEQFETIET